MSSFTIPEVCTQVVSRVDMRLTPHESDIFRFTLYWTLIIYLFLFGLPGMWALLVHLLPRRQWNPSSDGTALRRIPSTPKYHNTHSYASLEDLPLPSPAFSPSPHPSSADVQGAGATQASTSGQLRFAEPQPPTPVSPVSPVSSPAPSRGWDSWTPSIRLQNLRSRPFTPNANANANANTPRDHGFETASASVPPPTSLTPFSLSYIPASRPASSFIPGNGNNSAAAPLTRPGAFNAPPFQPPLRLSRFRKPAKSNLLLVLLIPLVFVLVGAVIGVSGSLVIGYLLAALRDSSDVRISTWLPLGWAVIQALGILSG